MSFKMIPFACILGGEPVEQKLQCNCSCHGQPGSQSSISMHPVLESRFSLDTCAWQFTLCHPIK